MKKIFRSIYALAAVSLLLASCAKEERFEPGQPDPEGCYGVYFAPLKQSNLVLSPEDAAAPLEFAICRENSKGDCTVPATAECLDQEGNVVETVKISDIKFLDGEEKTTFTVDVSKIKTWNRHTISLKIDDPMYISQYSQNFNNCFACTVSIESWIDKGKGTYFDSVFPTLLPVNTVPCDVTVFEKDGTPGMYKLENIYDGTYLSAYLSQLDAFYSPAVCAALVAPSTAYIDATNPEKVTYESEFLGPVFGTFLRGYGDINLSHNEKKPTYGVYDKDENAIVFEAPSLLLCEDGKPLAPASLVLVLPK